MRGQNSLHVLWFVGKDQFVTENIRRERISNSIEPVLEVLELVFTPTGEDGADDEVKPENWIPVAIRLCRFAAMKACELSRNDQSRDLMVGIVEEESGTETNGGEVRWREHDAAKTIVQKQ